MIMMPTGTLQELILRHFFTNFNHLHKYAIHLDGDEFIALKKHSSIKDLADEYIGNPLQSGQGAIALEWIHFDDNGLVS